MAIFKKIKSNITSVGEDVQKLELLCVGNVNGAAAMGNRFPQKVKY